MAATSGARLLVSPQHLLSAVIEAADHLPITQHPLGFMHFELTPILDLGDEQRVRLHLWNGNSAQWRDDLGLIHDHTWELNSFVVVGELSDVFLEAIPSPTGEFSCARVWYQAEAPPRVELMRGSFAIEEKERRVVPAGFTYRLPPQSLHTSDVKQLPTVTLVVATMRDVAFARVYGPGIGLAGERPRSIVSSAEARSALKSVLSIV